jgi:hypothetical protein
MRGIRVGCLLLSIALVSIVAGCKSGHKTHTVIVLKATSLPMQSSVPPLDPNVLGGDSQPPIVDTARVGLTQTDVGQITQHCTGDPDIGGADQGCVMQIVRMQAGHGFGQSCGTAPFCASLLFVPSTGRYVYQIVDLTAGQSLCGQGPNGTCFQLAVNQDAVDAILQANQSPSETTSTSPTASGSTSPTESGSGPGSGSPDTTNSPTGLSSTPGGDSSSSPAPSSQPATP